MGKQSAKLSLIVFPAHAGMSRNPANPSYGKRSFPRSRGDEPS